MLTMPEPAPVALVGDLLATQAKVHGAAAILVDAAVRDSEELAGWACRCGRAGSARAARRRTVVGELDVPVTRRWGRRSARATSWCSTPTARPSSPAERAEEVLDASRAREEKEAVKRAQLEAGALSYELDGLRAIVEGA